MWQNGHYSLAAMAEYPNLSQQNIVSELMDNPVVVQHYLWDKTWPTNIIILSTMSMSLSSLLLLRNLFWF